jgi:hypothetical protein
MEWFPEIVDLCVIRNGGFRSLHYILISLVTRQHSISIVCSGRFNLAVRQRVPELTYRVFLLFGLLLLLRFIRYANDTENIKEAMQACGG